MKRGLRVNERREKHEAWKGMGRKHWGEGEGTRAT